MTDRIWTVILAAGASTRFGGIKALAAWGNGTLLSHVIGTAARVTPDRIIVITGCHAEIISTHLDQILMVYNPDWESGRASSIVCGLRAAIDKNAEAVLLLPVDQPFVNEHHLKALSLQAIEKNQCILTQDVDLTGPPAAIPKSFFPFLLQLTGNQGLKAVLNETSTLSSVHALQDIDTPADLLRLSAMVSGDY